MSLLFSTGAFASSLSGAAPGMVLIKPSSITYTGTSATLGANGQVSAVSVSQLALNDVFPSGFTNFLLVVRGSTTSGTSMALRLRAGGSDASGSDYTRQLFEADGGTTGGQRFSSSTSLDIMQIGSTNKAGFSVYIYGPNLAEGTAFRENSNVNGGAGIRITDHAGTHSLTTAYDGLNLSPSNDYTGELAVYGIRS